MAFPTKNLKVFKVVIIFAEVFVVCVARLI